MARYRSQMARVTTDMSGMRALQLRFCAMDPRLREDYLANAQDLLL
jgi:hypothetical protein